MTEPGVRGLLASEHYRELPLGPLDARCVEALWCYEAPFACSQRVLPDGRMDLVAHAQRAPDGGLQSVWLAVAGPAEVWSRVPVRAGMLSVGVRFQLGWGGVCLGLAPAELRNQVLVGARVEPCLGPAAQKLRDARTPAALLQALTDGVLGLMARARPDASHARALHAVDAVVRAVAADGPANAGMAPAAGGSARALRRDVQKAVGLSLRTLTGVLRFQRAVALLDARALPSLAELASAAGYADQAHMTREFRRFGGFTPALPPPVPVLGAASHAWPNPSRPASQGRAHSLASISSWPHAHPPSLCHR